MTTEDFKRKLTAILSADVVGYSRLMGEDEAGTVKTLETYKGVMSSLIKQHRGRVVDSPGDNLLAEFGSVVDAVQCAVSIQKELQTRNVDLPENRRMEFRIGINLGDVIEEEDRIYGDGVNIAARLEALADPGGICISKTAFDYIENKLPFGYSFIGEQTVKNIAKPIGAYKVLMETRLVDEEEMKAKTTFLRRKSVLSFGIIVILVIAGILYWNFYLRDPIKPTTVNPEQIAVVPDVKEGSKTIAVLPFENISPEKDQEYFVDGLSEQIINDLTKISNLNVTSRTSSFVFKDSDKTAKKIAEILEREYILEGSVRKSGNALKITAQLIRAADDSHLWSETYDRELKDIFEIQEDIATKVADKLKLTLDALQLLGGTTNIKAYELYLNAKGKRIEGDIKSAFELLDSAIALAPDFALAWAFNSYLHVIAALRVTPDPFLELDLAQKAAEKAIDLEPNLSGAYIVLGRIYALRGEFLKSGKYMQVGLELAPESIYDYSGYGLAPYYSMVGYSKKAYDLCERIRKRDPLNPGARVGYFFNLGLLGNMDGAEEEYKKGKEIFGEYFPLADLCIVQLRLGSKDDLSINDIPVDLFPELRSGLIEYIKSPEKMFSELRSNINSEDQVNAALITLLAPKAGDPELALSAIEQTTKNNIFANFEFIWAPLYDEVRQLPRFKEFVREIGLLDYWKEYGWPDLCHPVDEDDFECN